MATTIKKEKSIKEEIALPCQKCSGKPCHLVLCEVNSVDGDENVTCWDDHLIVQCAGCKTVSFCVKSRFSEDFDHDDKGNMVLNESIVVYPERVDGRGSLIDSDYLPRKVAAIYAETQGAFASGKYVLAGVGIRALLEAVINDKKVVGKDLYNKINEMVPRGLITVESAKMLHKIRMLGNKSAHEVKANTKKELDVAIEIVEHLLSSVYVISSKSKLIRVKGPRKKKMARPNPSAP